MSNLFGGERKKITQVNPIVGNGNLPSSSLTLIKPVIKAPSPKNVAQNYTGTSDVVKNNIAEPETSKRKQRINRIRNTILNESETLG